MYLKALEIQGFKSFPDKTRLTFEKDITAIVGPNGSGKSNISDAILWVTGEQRSRALRGSKMEDVIFGGTALRNPLGYAEVSLLIDNSGKIFDSDSGEIELTRRYYRSGDSEYYINREQVRLKDIHSLLMDTGLGRDGYSIIGQGKIADIVSTKSQDRREVFDEAAGISRYRYRKEEAERRLEKTDENLLRINDKIEELELQVGPLKKQSEVAKRYLVLRDELRVREVSAWMETLDRIRDKAELINKEYEQSSSQLLKSKETLEALYSSSDSITERMHRKDEEIEHIRGKMSLKETEISDSENAAALLNANVESTVQNMNRLLDDISAQAERVREIQNNIAENETRISGIDDELKQIQEEIDSNNNILEGCRIKITSRENSVNSTGSRLNSIEVELGGTLNRVSMLEAMEKEFDGYSRAVKTVMKESSRGSIRGIHGPVANLVRSDDEYALAVETALGAAAQHIVIETRNDGRSAIEMLKRTDGGRATFLPLDTIRGDILADAPENEDGYVGIAYELCSFDDRYRSIVASIIGKTIVVETLADAVRISKKYNDKHKIVTLDGQLIHVGGSMTGGSQAKGTGILSRANELEKLKLKAKELDSKKSDCAKELEKLKQELSAVRYDLEMAMEDRNVLSSKQSSLNAEKQTIKSTINQFNILLDGISGDSETHRAGVEKAKEQIQDLKNKIDDKEKETRMLEKQLDEIKLELDSVSKSKLELEGKRTANDSSTKKLVEEISELERTVARIEGRKANSELEEKQLIDKLWENYELSNSAAQEIRRPVENLQALNKEISGIRREMSSLGTPNLGAIEEYERVSERYNFLTEQRDDVEKARGELLGIIRDVTGEMKILFLERFKLIDAEFRKTFTELFGGGKAALELEDEDNVLECGIEIKVQPPGKALNSISLLSGGEMAFVAIALYFSILKVRPAPFCVMDEIEAALDEANVSRFAEYLRRMSNRTQFLVITHRRGTMEEADMLYGVTMQEKGVSTVLELDLEQAKKTAEENR